MCVCVRECLSGHMLCPRITIQPKMFFFFFHVIIIYSPVALRSHCFATALPLCKFAAVFWIWSQHSLGPRISQPSQLHIYLSPVGWACVDNDSLRRDELKACVHLLALPPLTATLGQRHSTKSQFSAVSNSVWAELYDCHGLSRQVSLKRRWEMLMISQIECACYSLAVSVTLFVLHEFQWPFQRALELLSSRFDQAWINKATLSFLENRSTFTKSGYERIARHQKHRRVIRENKKHILL